MSSIVDFYRGTHPDYLGRRLADIRQWDDNRLEAIHNYIQVLFPSTEPSQFNARAPLLDEATIEEFRADPELRKNLAASHDRLLRFYGFEWDETTGQVVRAANFGERVREWVEPFNHNFLRITRILKCLMALGLEARARAFLAALQELYRDHARGIGPETLAYWKDAVP